MEVLLSLAGEHFVSKALINWNVVQEKLPCLAPVLWECGRNSIPGNVSKLIELDVWLIWVQHLVDLHALLLRLAFLDIAQYFVLVLLTRFIERRVFYLIFKVFEPIWQMLSAIVHFAILLVYYYLLIF